MRGGYDVYLLVLLCVCPFHNMSTLSGVIFALQTKLHVHYHVSISVMFKLF